jgi:hypothetical protein
LTNTFYPCLVQTTVWETWRWEDLYIDLPDKVLPLVEKGDVKGFLGFYNLPNTGRYRKAAVDVLDDLQNATGAVSAITKEAQDIIKTIANQ